MNDCQKIVNSIFICLVIIVLAIFLTGCHTTQFEWFPGKDKTMSTSPFPKDEGAPSEAVNILKVSF